MSHIATAVDFEADSIEVQVENDADGSMAKYGEGLMLAHLIFRIASITRNAEIKPAFLGALTEGSDGLISIFDDFIELWNRDMEQYVTSLGTNPTGNSKRGFLFHMTFSQNFYEPRLKPRGFGVLGKNIDLASFISICTIHRCLQNKHSTDTTYLNNINSLVKLCGNTLLLTGGKLAVQDEHALTLRYTAGCFLPKIN